VNDPASEQLDGNAADAGAPLEDRGFVETDDWTDDFDQSLCAPRQAARAEAPCFATGESLAEDIIEARIQAVTCHGTSQPG
jgi:hypothetical protein